MMETKIVGKVYVLGDNIDTDQIIPANYLTWDPSIPAERLKLGSKALDGLPDAIKARQPFMTPEQSEAIAAGTGKVDYPIIIGGRGFGCGSSREHAPNALGAAGIQIVVARGYARIFHENSVSTGELIPATSLQDLVEHFETGQQAEIDLAANTISNLKTGNIFGIEPLGYILPMVKAGGLFKYARQEGLIGERPSE